MHVRKDDMDSLPEVESTFIAGINRKSPSVQGDSQNTSAFKTDFETVSE